MLPSLNKEEHFTSMNLQRFDCLQSIKKRHTKLKNNNLTNWNTNGKRK